MTGPVLVGYTATKAGADAVALGARVADATASALVIAIVLPAEGRSVITPPDASYERHLQAQAEAWLSDAAAAVPAGVAVSTRIFSGDTFAEGLEEAATELGASFLIVGAANGSRRGQHRLGSTATALVHSADLPVALAPRGVRKADPALGVPRITVAVGTRPGAGAVIEQAVALATASGASIRLVSLVTVDLPASVDTGVIRIAGAAHADEVLAQTRAALPEGIEVEVVVGRGDSIEDAVSHLPWLPGELVLAGSSRLAQPRRLFLGSTAAKMLHVLTVPLVVVPRTSPSEGGAR